MFGGICILAFIFWKIIFSTDLAKNALKTAVVPSYTQSAQRTENPPGSNNREHHEQSSPPVSSALLPCPEGETRIAGASACVPWSNFNPIELQLIPDGEGVSAIVKGLTLDGKLIIQIINDTEIWEARKILVTLTNAQQHVDILNGHRSAPADSEQYSVDISILPRNFQSIEIITAWSSHVSYLVKIDSYGYRLK